MADISKDSNAADLDLISRAFGLVMIQWGQAEQSLDLCVAMLWQKFDGRKHASRIPMMLKDKIKFSRKCFSDITELKNLERAAVAVLDEFDRLSQLRHDMTHGAVSSLKPIDGDFVLLKLDIRDDYHHVREVRIAVSDYPKIAKELVGLGRSAHELGAAMGKKFKGTAGKPSIK